MNTVIRRVLTHSIGALVIGSLGLYPAPGMAKHSAVSTYRCAVGGDSAECHPSVAIPEVRIEKELVLGPYARYLVSRGESTRAAAAKAREFGEPVIERTVKITKRRLGNAQIYARALGGRIDSDYSYETLSEVRLDPSAVDWARNDR